MMREFEKSHEKLMMQGNEAYEAVEPPMSTNHESEFDQYADSYKQLVSQSTGDRIQDIDFYARQKIRILRKLLGKQATPLKILDFGCGIGLSLPPLQQAFRSSKIYATDPSEKSLAIATNSSTARAIPYSDLNTEQFHNTFDLIFTSCVFHHIDEGEHLKILANLLQLASPGGKLMIAEHNPWNPVTQRMVNNCPFDEGVILIPMPVMKKRMLAAGWENPGGRFMSFVPASFRKIGSIDTFLGWCPLGGQYMAYGIKE